MGAVIFALFAFLSLYTWNARTGYLDAAAEYSGLEVTGYLLLPGTWLKDNAVRIWGQYFALVDVAEENARLREELGKSERYLASVRNDLAELANLRQLMGIKPPEGWGVLGTRVLAGRFGPGAALDTVMIDRGFATGAAPDTPLVTEKGLAGKVFRASPHIATVLLLTDQAFRVAVISEQGRVPGVLAGTGVRSKLDVRYMAPNTKIDVGEILVTSGLDGIFPKGIPVARIVSVEAGMETLFPEVKAEPLVFLNSLERALLLIAPPDWPESSAFTDALPAPAQAPAREPAANAAPRAGAATTAQQRDDPARGSGQIGTPEQRQPRSVRSAARRSAEATAAQAQPQAAEPPSPRQGSR